MKRLKGSVKLIASQETIRRLIENSKADPRFYGPIFLFLIKRYLVTRD